MEDKSLRTRISGGPRLCRGIAELNRRTSIGLARAGPGVYSVFDLKNADP
jgi:hypothetical protein